MSVGKRIDGKEGGDHPFEEMRNNNETLGEALTKAGFEPARVGRKIVLQGKRREALKKKVVKDRGE